MHLCYYYLLFKAASLDGHMAFLVAVHYVIFYWFWLYASLKNKFFFFFFFFFFSLTPALLFTQCSSSTTKSRIRQQVQGRRLPSRNGRLLCIRSQDGLSSSRYNPSAVLKINFYYRSLTAKSYLRRNLDRTRHPGNVFTTATYYEKTTLQATARAMKLQIQTVVVLLSIIRTNQWHKKMLVETLDQKEIFPLRS